jgi:hypothetical protein
MNTITEKCNDDPVADAAVHQQLFSSSVDSSSSSSTLNNNASSPPTVSEQTNSAIAAAEESLEGKEDIGKEEENTAIVPESNISDKIITAAPVNNDTIKDELTDNNTSTEDSSTEKTSIVNDEEGKLNVEIPAVVSQQTNSAVATAESLEGKKEDIWKEEEENKVAIEENTSIGAEESSRKNNDYYTTDITGELFDKVKLNEEEKEKPRKDNDEEGKLNVETQHTTTTTTQITIYEEHNNIKNNSSFSNTDIMEDFRLVCNETNSFFQNSKNRETLNSIDSIIMEDFRLVCNETNSFFQNSKNRETLNSIDSILNNALSCVSRIQNNEQELNYTFTSFILRSFSNFQNIPLLTWFRSKFCTFKSLMQSQYISHNNKNNEFTTDEFAWFSFYNKSFVRNKRWDQYKLGMLDITLNSANTLEKTRLLSKYNNLATHDEICTIVKKYKLLSAEKNVDDTKKFEMTDLEKLKYEKINQLITKSKETINKPAIKIMLENAFNFAVLFSIRCNVALNMCELQSNLTTEIYSQFAHSDVIDLSGIVSDLGGPVAFSTIKSWKYKELMEVFQSSTNDKNLADKEILNSAADNLDVFLPQKKVMFHRKMERLQNKSVVDEVKQEPPLKQKRTFKKKRKSFSNKQKQEEEDDDDEEEEQAKEEQEQEQKQKDVVGDVKNKQTIPQSETILMSNEKVLLLQNIKNQFLIDNLLNFEFIGNVEQCVMKSFADYQYDRGSSSSTHISNKDDNTTFRQQQGLIEKFDDNIWESFATLHEKEWLNSTVIAVYCEMMNDRELALWKENPTRSKSFFVNSWLIGKVQSVYDNSYESEFQNLNIFNFDQIFICVNILNQHWVLMRVDINTRIIECFDSIKPSDITTALHNANMESIKDWLVYEQLAHDYEAKLCKHDVNEEWKTSIVDGNLRQTDGYNCGIHMLIAAFFLSDFESYDSYNDKIIDSCRTKIAIDIFKGFIEDPRITDRNDYHFSYKSFEFFLLSEQRQLELQIPHRKNNSKVLKQTNMKIKEYFQPQLAIVDLSVDEEATENELLEYLPSKDIIDSFNLSADDDVAFVQRTKKRKLNPKLAYQTLHCEIGLLRKGIKVYQKLVGKIYNSNAREKDLQTREEILNKREEELIKKEIDLINKNLLI